MPCISLLKCHPVQEDDSGFGHIPNIHGCLLCIQPFNLQNNCLKEARLLPLRDKETYAWGSAIARERLESRIFSRPLCASSRTMPARHISLFSNFQKTILSTCLMATVGVYDFLPLVIFGRLGSYPVCPMALQIPIGWETTVSFSQVPRRGS